MATDPATQFQQAGLNIPYQFVPTVTHLNPPIQLPGTGELWAHVGQTALNAAQQVGDMLQKSPLNPAVKAEMDAQRAAAAQGIAQGKWLASLPNNLGRYMIGVDAAGNAVYSAPAGITDPTLATMFQQATGVLPKPGGDDGKGPPKVNNPTVSTGDQTTTDNQGFEASEYNAPGASTTTTTTTKKAPAAPPTTKQMGTTSVPTNTSDLSASTDNSFLMRRMMEEREAAGLGGSSAAQPGTPSNMTFTNPATGNVEPLQMFAPPTPGAPPPPAPTQQPGPQMTLGATAQPPPGMELGGAPQPDQASMANWQAQNAHPVMASTDALKWAQNFDTGAQRATYLPHGGPNGEPAYAFHMKGGGINTVPISQIVKNGGGPLVAGQNTSATLSTSDALMNQPPAQPQGMTLGATAQPPPGMQLQPPGQPPSAPGPTPMPSGTGAAAPQGTPAQAGPPAAPGMTDISGNPLSAYTNVPSRGGPSLGYLSAGGDNTPPVQPRPLWEIVPQADQDAAQAKAKDMGDPSGEYKGDRVVPGTTGPYTFYRNDDHNSPSYGRVYTVLPGKAGEYFNQQRWYLGSTNYDSYELPDSQLRKDVADYWIPTGQGPSRQEIESLPPEQLKVWARQAWINQNTTRTPADQGQNETLDAVEQYHHSLQKIGDILQTLKAHGVDVNSLNNFTTKLKNGLISLGMVPPDPASQAYQDLNEEVDRARGLVKSHPNLLLNPGQAEGVQLPDLKLGALLPEIPLPSIPGSDVLSDSAFSGQPLDVRLKNLNALQKAADARYQNLIGTAQDNWFRVDPRHVRNMSLLADGKPLPADPGNLYSDHTYPGEPPTIDPEHYPEWAKANPGKPFMTKGPNPVRRWAPPAPTPTPK